ncbi:hypothetical protein HDU98_003693 [Podochytrium sp. JEL0797]|nr:hypothetical protein HDU98_003693 [Podochytrium sp. JEL0797]
MARLNQDLAERRDLKAFRVPVMVLSGVLGVFAFTGLILAYSLDNWKNQINAAVAVAIVTAIAMRVVMLKYRPRYLQACRSHVWNWTEEDARLGVNLVYRFSDMLPIDLDTLRFCTIEVYELVIWRDSGDDSSLMEMVESLPAYSHVQ